MNIFTIPPYDQSVYFLTYIFGNMGSVLPPSQPSLMGALLRVLNTIALSVGALMLVYTTVVGLLATAHEGEFMGKKWSGLWVPLRSLMGIAALFPTPSGYSILQMIFMWVILQGVGAADSLWSTVINYSHFTSGPQGRLPGPDPGITQLYMRTLFQATTCTANLRASYDDKFDSGGTKFDYYYCHPGNNDAFCKKSLNDILKISSDPKQNTLVLGPSLGSLSCGVLTYCDESKACGTEPIKNNYGQKLICEACRGQKQGLQTILPVLGAIAETVVNYDHDYLHFYWADNTKGITQPQWIVNYCTKVVSKDRECCLRPPDSCETEFKGDEKKIANCYCSKLFDVSIGELDSHKRCMNAFDRFKVFGKCYTREEDNPFFLPYIKNPPDYFDTSKDALTKIYWPYAIKDYLKNSDFIKASAEYYSTAVTNGISKGLSEAGSMSFGESDEDKIFAEAKNQGWIFAGSYYHRLAQMSGGVADFEMPILTVQDITSTLVSSPIPYRNNYLSIRELFTETSQGQSNATWGAGIQGASAVSEAITSTADSILNSFMWSMTKSNDRISENPLGPIHQFGSQLIALAESFYFIIFISIFVSLIFAKINFIIWGSGLTENPMGGTLSVIVFIILPLILGILAALVSFGSMLAVYVPLVPYILYVMGGLGWVIAVIEAIVAAPLVALGMLSAGGQHEILGRAEPAAMMLLNVFLRPSLMVIGMMAAMFLAYVGILIVNNTFLAVIAQIGGGSPSIIESLGFVGAYVFLIISVLNKCFSLIHLLPERVITWIGGHAVSYGEGEALGEVKKGAEAAAGAAAAGAGAALKGAGEAPKVAGEADLKAEEGEARFKDKRGLK